MQDRIWDPLRKKSVALTPEEEVRQWFICQLKDVMGVPEHMMMSEVGFSIGSKKLRADIVVYGRDTRPVAIVECKRPDVDLSREVLEQAVAYNLVLNVQCIIVTNGKKTRVCMKGEDGKFSFAQQLPAYEELLKK